MREKIYQLVKGNLLLKGSLVVLIGSTLANFGNYLFHLFMGRLLGPAEYGLLESLISLTYFLGVPVGVLSLVMVKFISQESNKEKVAGFTKTMAKRVALAGAVGLLVFLSLFPLLRSLIKVDSFFLILGVGIFSYFGLFSMVCSATLQGIMDFAKLSLFSIFTPWVKLLLASMLVIGGLGVSGAIGGIVAASLLSLILGYLLLKRKLPLTNIKTIEIKKAFNKIGHYSLATFVSTLSLTSFYTVDIILARYFLPPVLAGQYALLSILGKIIFFASNPITMVMFPMVSERRANGKGYQELLGLSILMVAIVSAAISILYFVFPNPIMGIFGDKYSAATASLGFFAVFISLYSLSSLLMNFFLSISATSVVYWPAILAVFQVIFISVYHHSLNEIIFVNIVIMALLLVGLWLYYLKAERLKVPILAIKTRKI
jgi:O-antigen/teichoic acid export membrane protein